jgi:3-oxoadipate enol-lactonase
MGTDNLETREETGALGAPERHLDAVGRRVEIAPGVTLWCAEEGEGPTTLLLGGFTAGHNVFELVWPYLREEYRVVAVEPRGLSGSDCPDPATHDYGVEMWADDLAATIEHLGAGPVRIWAQGFSSYYALKLAATRPELVAALVAYTDVWAADPVKGYGKIWPVYRSIVEGYGTTGFGARMVSTLFDVPSPPWFYEWERQNIETVLHPETVAATVGHCLTEADIRDDLAAIEAPVMVLQGDGDWGQGEMAADPSLELMEERIAGLEVCRLPDHPGYVLIQRPEECARAVIDFFKRAAPGDAGTARG